MINKICLFILLIIITTFTIIIPWQEDNLKKNLNDNLIKFQNQVTGDIKDNLTVLQLLDYDLQAQSALSYHHLQQLVETSSFNKSNCLIWAPKIANSQIDFYEKLANSELGFHYQIKRENIKKYYLPAFYIFGNSCKLEVLGKDFSNFIDDYTSDNIYINVNENNYDLYHAVKAKNSKTLRGLLLIKISKSQLQLAKNNNNFYVSSQPFNKRFTKNKFYNQFLKNNSIIATATSNIYGQDIYFKALSTDKFFTYLPFIKIFMLMISCILIFVLIYMQYIKFKYSNLTKPIIKNSPKHINKYNKLLILANRSLLKSVYEQENYYYNEISRNINILSKELRNNKNIYNIQANNFLNHLNLENMYLTQELGSKAVCTEAVTTNLEDYIYKIVNNIMPIFKFDNIELYFNYTKECPKLFVIDQKILNNVINNLLIFTKDFCKNKEVLLEVLYSPSNTVHSQVTILIQTESNNNAKINLSQTNIALAKNLLDTIGGNLVASNEKYLTLKMELLLQQKSSKTTKPTHNLEYTNIAVLSKSHIFRQLFSNTLLGWHVNPVEASSIKQLVTFAKDFEHNFDAIILDSNFADVYKLLESIRVISNCSLAKIIVVGGACIDKAQKNLMSSFIYSYPRIFIAENFYYFIRTIIKQAA